MMQSALFRHPAYRTGGVVSRITVCGVTLFWSAIVLWKDHALNPLFPGWAMLLRLFDEDVWGGLAGMTAAVLGAHVLLQWRHRWYVSCGYALLTGFWIWVSLWIIFGPGGLHPAASACIWTISILSFHAFISSAKRDAALA